MIHKLLFKYKLELIYYKSNDTSIIKNRLNYFSTKNQQELSAMLSTCLAATTAIAWFTKLLQ
jgi:hypothetical protein